jgi:hypothetical protein
MDSPPPSLAILAEAAAAFWGGAPRPAASDVVKALLAAESTTRHQHTEYPFPSLLGQWRLCFTTGSPKADRGGGNLLSRGWYVPRAVKAQISFAPCPPSDEAVQAKANRGEINNQAQLGTVQFKFNGPCQYLGKKNLLAFDFTRMEITLFGRNVYGGNIRSGRTNSVDFDDGRAIAKLPFFAFFLVTEDFIAARGRGGGLAIWVRDR